MSNEQIMQELLLKFKGTGKSAKIPLIEQIRDIVGVLMYSQARFQSLTNQLPVILLFP